MLAVRNRLPSNVSTKSTRPDQGFSIDFDFDDVSVADFGDRTAGERFRADVADAGTGADTGKPWHRSPKPPALPNDRYFSADVI